MNQAIRSILSILGAGLLLGTVSSCSGDKDISPPLQGDGLNVTVTKPIHRDYQAIKDTGVLRMITRYSSNTYFLHQGLEWGFEYELVHKFAEEHDLALKIVIVGPDRNPYDLLNNGTGDLIAANYTITPTREKYVQFTRPYNVVNQVVVYSDDIENPPATLEDLVASGIPLTVRRNSSYYQRLRTLQKQGYDLKINLVSNEKDTEALLFDVSQDIYQATVADDNIYQASDKYMAGLQQGPTIAKNDTIAWAIRKNAPDLETELNKFLYKHFRFGAEGQPPKRSTFLNVLRQRYFEAGPQIANYYHPEQSSSDSGIISPYDDLIKKVADSAGVDWVMIASMIAQETKFNPKSKSWAGAIGLMQVLPRFSEVTDTKELYNEKINIREGVRIISEHLKHYAYMDSTNQWAFALATYNAGPGHVADARRIAINHNKDPNQWKNAADGLLKLMQRKYYKDARYGFCRGIETVRYVQEIMNRHKTYETILAMAERNERRSGPGIIGLFKIP